MVAITQRHSVKADDALPRQRLDPLRFRSEDPWEQIVRRPFQVWKAAFVFFVVLTFVVMTFSFLVGFTAMVMMALLPLMAVSVLLAPILAGWFSGRALGRTLSQSPLVAGMLTTETGTFSFYAVFLERQLHRIVKLMALFVILLVILIIGTLPMAGFTWEEVLNVVFYLFFFFPAVISLSLTPGLLAFDISFRRHLEGRIRSWKADGALAADVLLRVILSVSLPLIAADATECLLMPAATAVGVGLCFWCLTPFQELPSRTWDALVAGAVGEEL